jgi:5-methylcytosine-specific restriction endonuclease McrA
MTAHDKQVYNSRAWQRLRRVKLQDTPLCESCSALGRLVPATVVDHRLPISSGGDAFPTLDELMSMCEPCHNYKSRGAGQRLRHERLRRAGATHRLAPFFFPVWGIPLRSQTIAN